MARMVGVWIWVATREVADDVNITVGGTVNLTEQDVRQIGNQALSLRIRIMDDDTISDDEVAAVSDTFAGPFKEGPNSFQTQVIVPHDDVSDSEPGTESWAELYARVRVPATTVTGAGSISTKWENSQNENVQFAA
jgi:hypothetical protein